MHLRSWLYSTLLFSVPTTAFYPFNIVDALPDHVEHYALKDLTRYDNSQDGESPAAREKHGWVPALKMTRRALPVSYQKSATACLDLICGLAECTTSCLECAGEADTSSKMAHFSSGSQWSIVCIAWDSSETDEQLPHRNRHTAFSN